MFSDNSNMETQYSIICSMINVKRGIDMLMIVATVLCDAVLKSRG